MTNRSIARCTVALAAVLLAGCGSDSGPAPDAPVSETGEAAAPVTAPAGGGEDLAALLASADLDRGQTLFLQCRACHSLGEGEAHKVGPNLYGMFGRKAGLAAGFAYSPALEEAEVVWTPEALDEWLERPSEYLPGNRMVFIGIKKPADRAHLIAYLQQATAPAQQATAPE